MLQRYKTKTSWHTITISIPGRKNSFYADKLEITETGDVFGILTSGRSVWTTATTGDIERYVSLGILVRTDEDLRLDTGL